MKNRILTLSALVLLAMPAFAETTTTTNSVSSDTSNTSNTSNSGNTSNTGTDTAMHNMAGMTGVDKQTIDVSLGNGACSNDVQQFCSDVNPGQGRVAACLHSHNDQISTQCQSQMKTAFNEFRTIRKDCKADVAKFCSNMKPGQGAVISCLKQHEDQLSTACRSDEMSIPQSTSSG